MNELIKIYYFSGTGNSLWSAKKIAEKTGAELINIGAEMEKSEVVLDADAVVLLYPAYAYGPPLIVRNFIKRAVIKTNYLAAFVTYGTSPGGALAGIKSIVKKKTKCPSYFGKIPSVENYIAIFGPPKPKTAEARLRMQSEATEKAAAVIIERKTNKINIFRPFSTFVFTLFTIGVKIFYKWYDVNKTCNSCGICAKVCPVSAITMKNGKPEFSRKCEHCQGCLNFCPQRAISFVRLKPATPRYNHPEIKVSDISR